MASYEDTVNSFNPVAFFRLDELLGSVMVDSSGNARHGAYYGTGTFGIASPIETDAGSSAISGAVGSVSALTVPDISSVFTWIVWGYSGGVVGRVLICRNKDSGFSSANVLQFIGNATIQANLANASSSWSLESAELPANTWFMAAVTKNANVMRLYVNAVLVAERIDLPVGSLAPYIDDDDLWAFGRGVQSAAFASSGTDEVALFDTALSAANLLTIYESALNATFLRGHSNVIPSAVLYSTIEPDPIEFPFRHNWSDPLIERISFRTNVSKARSGPQENSQVRPNPRREIEITQVMRDNSERRRLRAQLWANQNRKWFVPMLEDREQLTAPLAAGATVIPVSTLYKDYEVGSYIGLRQLNDAGVIVKSETLQIESLTNSSVTTAVIANDYAAYLSSAYPVRRGLITPSQIRGHTDAVEEVTITARLLAEDEAAVPNRITTWLPTLKYRDVEVFDPAVWQSHDWSDRREYDSQRQLDEIDFDSGIFGVESDTAGAEEVFTYRIVLKGREDIAAFLGWFYERAGALNYIWVASMQSDFDIISVLGSTITVSGTNYSDNFALAQPRRDLAFVYHDNTMQLRRVISFAGSDNETLTLGAAVPTLTNLRSLSLLKFCQLDADSLEIAKETDDVWVFAWRFRELLTTPEGTGLSSLSPSASVSPSHSPSASQSPSSSVSPSISPSGSASPSGSQSPSASISPSRSPSASVSPSGSVSPSSSASPSVSPSGSTSPSSSGSPSV